MAFSKIAAENLGGSALPAIGGGNLTGISAGKIGQLVSTNVDSVSLTTSSDSWADISGFSAAITPSATSSKVWILVTLGLGNGTQTSNNFTRLLRGSTSIGYGASLNSNVQGTGFWRVDQGGQSDYDIDFISFSYLDSPSTTSATTYKVQWATNAGTLYLNRAGDLAGSGAWEHGPVASNITVMELLA
tara:strand:+ start:828 stop:1391 length:564 start_codon:yes stop_codon:yes gene_type:complete